MSSKKSDGANEKADHNRELIPQLRFPEFRAFSGWKKRKLSDVLTPTLREVAKPLSAYLALGIRSHGKGTFHKPDQAPEKTSMDRLYLVHRNDLIVNITFAWEGAIAIANDVDHGSYVSHRFPTYTFKASVSQPGFFRYIITRKAFVHKLGLISPGGAGRNKVLNKTDFLGISILLPSPKEQQRIADCLTSIDELITAETEKLDALKAHKKGLMLQLFPAEGETAPCLRFPEFQDADEWETECISDLGRIVTGSTPSTAIPEFYGGERLFVSPADISGERFISRTNTTLTERGFGQTRPIPPNSILFVCIGSTIGKVAQNLVECASNQQINAVIPSVKHCAAFLYYTLTQVAPQIAALAGRHAVPIINKTAFGNVGVILPKRAEQERIAECLSSLDERITAQTRQIEALRAQKTGLMQQLFPSLDEVQA